MCQVYPEREEAAALLHFTGSGKFNRSFSRLANQAGWPRVINDACAHTHRASFMHVSRASPIISLATLQPPLDILSAGSPLGVQAGWVLSELGLRPAEKHGGSMHPTGPYVHIASERDIFERLGVRWLEPRERDGKFSLLHPESGRPWFDGGMPSGTELQALQLAHLRRAGLELPVGWKLQGPSASLASLPPGGTALEELKMRAAGQHTGGAMLALGPPLRADVALHPLPDSDDEDLAGLPALSRD